MSQQNKPRRSHSTRKPISLEDIKKLMSREEMKAFAAACRIRYGTAESEDYEVVAQHVRKLAAKQRSDAGNN
jgi:hypothetical protein